MNEAFKQRFGSLQNCYKIFSPYRVCPMGAHVDHQHGLVTGFAFDQGVELLFAPTDDGSVEMSSLTFGGDITFNVMEAPEIKQGNWGDYLRGVVYALKKRFELTHGIKGVIKGSLPIGGLSSSAAVLVAYTKALTKANNIRLTPMEIIKATSEAEREYVGLNNGILDQACVVLCKKNALLFLDTDTNEYRIIPKNEEMPDFEIGIFFSGLTRNLVGSDYNLRVIECKTAAWNMLAYSNLPLRNMEKTFLRDVPRELYEKYRERMPERFARRAEHFYSEYYRVRQGVTAWELGHIERFGELSFESCESSIHNYECGSDELISIYEIMRQTDGIYGGRFSGAGFKGACICLIDPQKKEQIKKQVTEKYLAKYPQYEDSFQIFFCKTDDGARFVDIDD